MHKKTQLSIILILVLTYLLPVKHGYILGSTWEHFVYIFFHANIFHLAGNCYCTWLILKNNNSKTLIPLYTLSVLASFIAYNNLPTIGFSAPLFVALGINFHKTKNKKTYIPAFNLGTCKFTIPPRQHAAPRYLFHPWLSIHNTQTFHKRNIA